MSASLYAAPRAIPGFHVTSYAGLAWFMTAFELGPWDEYLIQELTPDLDRLTSNDSPRVSWLQLDDRLIVPEFGMALIDGGKTSLAFTLRQRYVAAGLHQSHALQGPEQIQFEQSLVMPGITQRVSDRNALTVSAVFASQRFGSSGMNLNESTDLTSGYRADRGFNAVGHGHFGPSQEVVHGAGVRLALNSEVASSLLLEAAYQSRIDMSEFASIRGVHGSQAELDIASRVQLGLQFLPTSRSAITVGVSQIFYSEVGAFPSRSLPARFTALLGDSNSPQFAWEDLTVYNVGWQWRHDSDFEFSFDYRTRSQPKPSAPALAAALGPELAQNAFMVGLSKGFGQRARVHMNAAYAPPEFAFGGNVLGVVSDKLDRGVEVQTGLSLTF